MTFTSEIPLDGSVSSVVLTTSTGGQSRITKISGGERNLIPLQAPYHQWPMM
jgi:hypothetical protein